LIVGTSTTINGNCFSTGRWLLLLLSIVLFVINVFVVFVLFLVVFVQTT
jgi:hypothetical protein